VAGLRWESSELPKAAVFPEVVYRFFNFIYNTPTIVVYQSGRIPEIERSDGSWESIMDW
jgi:hypothetical protein